MTDEEYDPTVARTVLTDLCRTLGVDPARVSRIVLTGSTIEIVDERYVIDPGRPRTEDA